ncbi:hypothetical protein [Streptomyces sp. RKAG293]|uniref:hypothetical protein n=1 Tax=Streptomyces sp. RKAG293 TaxID=2893403 RepID=UPI00203443CC|nr:hypothetical protein [Streptomyces sp. RKAG293]MCM2420229.1 hypothetical protein [Streptomyces sp. RKAG293]
MHKSLRYISATAVAAVAIGVAGPTASAAQTHLPAPAAVAEAASTDSQTVRLTAGEVAEIQRIAAQIQAETAAAGDEDAPRMLSGKSEAGKKMIALLKKSPALFKAALKAAKSGHKAFKDWMDKQNAAIRAAWWLLSGGVQSWVIDELAKLVS